jgi:hypothetical protein
MLEFGKEIGKTVFGWLDEDKYVTYTTGGRKIDPRDRHPVKRQYFMPLNYYDPVFGVPGQTEHPTTVSGRVNLPVQMRDHPSTVLYGGHSTHKDQTHWINTPEFWEHYRHLKATHNDWNYDPNMQLGAEHFQRRAAVRMRNNANGDTVYSVDRRRTPMQVNRNNFYTPQRVIDPQ